MPPWWSGSLRALTCVDLVLAPRQVGTAVEGESFHVMLDGVVFGPFSRIRIRPQDSDDKAPGLDKNHAVEIMSFLPLATV